MITIDLRGHDLVITPPGELLHLPTPELLTALFGSQLPASIHNHIGRDKRSHFLRTYPIFFNAVKRALQQQQTPFTVAFEERPTLPFSTSLQVEPRPYQEEAL
ncbi:MAG: ATP-dependent helicase, partial [Chloroflexi bacterium]